MRHDEANRTMDRPRYWLAALERELKSRIGWADEAISPFRARKRKPASAPLPVVQARRVTPHTKAA
jgi:hypothetical protein